MTNSNHLLEGQEDYWAGYQASIDSLKNDPEHVAFDELCFHVFALNEEGKKLMKYFEDHILLASVPTRLDANFDKACVYYEGYREAFRQLRYAAINYKKRKEAEDNKKIKAASGE